MAPGLDAFRWSINVVIARTFIGRGEQTVSCIFGRVSSLRLVSVRAQKLRIPAALVAVACCALAAASVEQHAVSWNEYSHFAQVRALASGTARIDAYRHTTGDRALYKGHVYSDKAPGMGLLLAPAYPIVRSVGVVKPGGLGMIHILALFGCVVPLAMILLLAYWAVERHDPGEGAAVAITLGLGTILLPFATTLFSHELSAALGFGSCYLLFRERERDGGLALVAAAGALGGYAITTEYPLALLVALLGVFVAWRPAPARVLLVYLAGVAVGLIPLALYDWWAFGSPFHLSYQYVAANSSGVLGLGAPSLWTAVKLLISGRGLFVVTPVTAAAIAGIVVLYREGRRAEALVPAAVCGLYLAFNACYYLPFGGATPGPRFLLIVLPFLAVPLGAAYRKAPLATLSLAAVSAATMMTATVTLPILSLGWSTSTWWRMLGSGTFSTRGVTVVMFAAFALLAIVFAARATPKRRPSSLDIKLTAVGLGGWFAIQRVAPPLLAHDSAAGWTIGLVALVAFGVALSAVVAYVANGRRLALLAALPLSLLVMRRFDATTPMFCAAAASVGLLVLFARTRRVPARHAA